MFHEDSDQLKELEAALGFEYDDQDWGIVNSDASRVAEFVMFFEKNYDERWSLGTVGEFVDLVLESACEAVRADPNFDLACIDNFVAMTIPLAPQYVAYWSSKDRAVTPHLRELGC